MIAIKLWQRAKKMMMMKQVRVIKHVTTAALVWAALLLMVEARPVVATPTMMPTAAVAESSEAAVRGVVKRAFEQLRSGQYSTLYDVLPPTSQRLISRERFTSALERTRGMYQLDRLEISTVGVSGSIAVVDTVVYGRVRRPFENEGKIVARQYLTRENGQWRVATGDRSTVAQLLAKNPKFARQYPPGEPHVYIKRDGRWVDIGSLSNLQRRMIAR